MNRVYKHWKLTRQVCAIIVASNTRYFCAQINAAEKLESRVAELEVKYPNDFSKISDLTKFLTWTFPKFPTPTT